MHLEPEKQLLQKQCKSQKKIAELSKYELVLSLAHKYVHIKSSSHKYASELRNKHLEKHVKNMSFTPIITSMCLKIHFNTLEVNNKYYP